MGKREVVFLAAVLSAAVAGGCGGSGPQSEQRAETRQAGRAAAPAPRVRMQQVELWDSVEFQVPESWGSRRTAWWADDGNPQAAFIRVTRIYSHNIKSEVEKIREDAGEFKSVELGGRPAMLLEGEAAEPGIAGKIPFRKYFLVDRLPDRAMLSVRITGTDMGKHMSEFDAVLSSFKIRDTIALDAMAEDTWQGITFLRPAAWPASGGAAERMRWYAFTDPFRGTEYSVMLSLNFEFNPDRLDQFPWAGGNFRKIGNRWESGDGVVDNKGRPYRRQFYHIEAGGKKLEVSSWVNGAYDFGKEQRVLDLFKESLNIK